MPFMLHSLLRLFIFLQALHLILRTNFCCLRVILALKLVCFSTVYTSNVFMLVYFGLLYCSLSLLSSNLLEFAPRCHCFSYHAPMSTLPSPGVGFPAEARCPLSRSSHSKVQGFSKTSRPPFSSLEKTSASTVHQTQIN